MFDGRFPLPIPPSLASTSARSFALPALAVAALTVAGAATDLQGTPSGALPEAADGDSVVATVHAFHEALSAGDSTRALELLHPELRVFEGGHAEDRREYRSGHLAADMEFAAGTEREVLAEEVVRPGEGWALYLSEYRMTGTFRGREIDARGTETMVLVRTEAGWRIRHIHWSSR